MLLDILITLFLVLLNGFFVAAEFAIVKVRSSQVETTGHRKLKIADTAKTIINHLDSYLAATQLGITLASLGLGWVGESVVSSMILKIFNGLNLDISEKLAAFSLLSFCLSEVDDDELVLVLESLVILSF